MNICVTGCCGHIGSGFIRQVFPAVQKIYLVDNFLTQRYFALFDLPRERTFSFHEIDILSREMEAIIDDSDIVVHLAAVTDAETSFYKKDQVEKINKEGLEHVARLCAAKGKRLIFPSTTSVYGVQLGVVDENCEEKDLKPQSPYAESKLYAENLLKELGKSEGLKFITLRLGTIFGYSPGMRFHTAVNKFIWQASAGKPISVWETALHQKRPYCDLNDAIAAFNYVIEKDVFDNEIYNIVTHNLTVNIIIDAIKKFIPKLEVEFVKSPIMNQLSYEASARKSLERGFNYTGNLEASIKECLSKLKGLNNFIKKRWL